MSLVAGLNGIIAQESLLPGMAAIDDLKEAQEQLRHKEARFTVRYLKANSVSGVPSRCKRRGFQLVRENVIKEILVQIPQA